MKRARLEEIGKDVPVLVDDHRFYDLRSIVPDIDGFALSTEGLSRIAASVGSHPEPHDTPGPRIGSPIARPSVIVRVGLNYLAHAAESGESAPFHPVIFLKAPNTVGGPNDPVEIPRKSRKTDWDLELGLVIGANGAKENRNRVSVRSDRGSPRRTRSNLETYAFVAG